MGFPFLKNKSVAVWFGVNKDGTVVMFASEPTKDEKNGRWVSKFPMVNSIIYPQVCMIAEKTKMTFESEIQFIEFMVK